MDVRLLAVNINELALEAAKALSLESTKNFIPNPVISLIMAGQWNTSNYKYLAGRKSPKGQIVQEYDDNRLMVIFDAMDVLAWCIANGATSVKVTAPNNQNVADRL